MILITEHASLIMTALTGGKEMRNMRQQRYAMDLSEHALTIVHRAGALLHLPDALSRLGYDKRYSDSPVAMISSTPVEECTMEKLKEKFKWRSDGYPLEAEMRVAGQTVKGGIKGLYKRLQQEKVIANWLDESEEEESRVVEAYDAALVAVLREEKAADALVAVTTRRSKQKQQKQQVAEDSEYSEEEDEETRVKLDEVVDCEVQQPKQVVEAKSFVDSKPRNQAGELAVPDKRLPLTIKTDTIKSMQEEQPHMKAVKEYTQQQILPADRLDRIRVLEAAPLYEVNHMGLLCRVREKGHGGSLGLDMQVMIPEPLRGEIIRGCHQGVEGDMAVIKTYQKVRERFYWPGMF